jgi:hypothetical protein
MCEGHAAIAQDMVMAACGALVEDGMADGAIFMIYDLFRQSISMSETPWVATWSLMGRAAAAFRRPVMVHGANVVVIGSCLGYAPVMMADNNNQHTKMEKENELQFEGNR